MERISATEAARRFSEVLDAVEHRGETYLVVRNGRQVAQIGPTAGATGRAVKDFFRRRAPDPRWADDLRELRESLVPEERSWTD